MCTIMGHFCSKLEICTGGSLLYREAAASGGGKREHFGNFDHSCTQIDRQKDGLGK